jgi:hypothetical protein
MSGVRLMNQLETGDGQLGRLWREQVHTQGNVGMTREFNTNPSVQLFDAMMRNPAAGERIFSTIDEQAAARPAVIQGINALAREEISRTELNRLGELTVRGPDGTEHRLTANGWTRPQDQQQDIPRPQPAPRQIDQLDHIDPGRFRIPAAGQRQGLIDERPPPPRCSTIRPTRIIRCLRPC